MTLDEVINYNRLLADMEYKSGDLEVAEYYLDTAECLEELKELREQKAEYKQLLKIAVDDIARTESCLLCKYYDKPDKSCQTTDACFVWRHAEEALKLIEI